MHNLTSPVKESFTEQEAAETLGMSIPTLHDILDEHIFNDGTPRPDNLHFTPGDLVLIAFWHKSMTNPKVVHMPRRR